MTAAIFGLLGVIVGGVLNGLISWWLQRHQERSSARTIAALVYDDFVHFQSTLVRALAAGSWWKESYLLQEQVQPDDWKLLLGALSGGPSQDVASARGWMLYLIARWREIVPRTARKQLAGEPPQPQQPPTPLEEDLQVMRDTFCRLDRGRRQLAKLSGRSFSTFADGGVLATLNPPRTLQDLGIDPDECRARRKAGYSGRRR